MPAARDAEIVALSAKRRSAGTKLRIGFLRLTDAAPIIVAQEFGFFAEESVDAELSLEPSWANIADKLAYGFLDAAVVVPPLAFAVELGFRGVPQPLLIPCAISLGGNTVTLERGLAERVRALAERDGLTAGKALAACLVGADEPLRLGIVHAYSTHNLLLRYWLAAAGIDPARDVRLSVVPPARAVEALQSGHIAGFCAGAPWGEVALRAGSGATIATSNDIWRNAPEKAFAVTKRWADAEPDALSGAIRAVVRAAQFCDAPQNASYTASLLSRHKYLDVDSHAILSSLPGGAITRDNVSTFYANAANFPWRSHGLWFLNAMARWNLIESTLDRPALAARLYRPDLYRAAVAPLGIAVPHRDAKTEGTHKTGWMLDGAPAPIPMGADLFCDGAVFSPEAAEAPASA